MSVKLFLPAEIFHVKENCDIYGEIQISENNAISYFVIAHSTKSADSNLNSNQRLRNLGYIERASPATHSQQRDVSLTFAYDVDIPNIYLVKLSIKPPAATNANIFLYDASKILKLHFCNATNKPKDTPANKKDSSTAEEQCDDLHLLFQLLQDAARQQHSEKRKPRTYGSLVLHIFNLPLELITRVFVLLLECRPFVFVMRRTVLYEHYLEWCKFRKSGKREYNITLDKILGIGVMLILLLYIAHPGDYLIEASHMVIKELRLLLRALKGSPIGLKLNVHLNNFLLDCFNYHVDLWEKFLDLIEPLVRQLFVPIALLGSMGLSYQLALLADLISVMGLHAHCFYIYTAVLYKVEIKGLQVLWKVVLGKRYNTLKKRVESHNYMNRQLYLATIFFTTLLFLFPTIIVYYSVFTALRLCIYLVYLLLQQQRRRILEFPLQSLIKWLSGSFYEMESIQLQHTPHAPSPLLQPESTQMRMSVFKINVQSSSLSRVFSCESGVLQELITHEQITLKSIFNRILEGKF